MKKALSTANEGRKERKGGIFHRGGRVEPKKV